MKMEFSSKYFTKQYTQSLKQCSQSQYAQFIPNSIVTFLKTSLQFQSDDRIINTASLLNVRKCNSKTDTEIIPNRIILQSTDVTFVLSVTFRTWRLRRSELLLPERSVWGRANSWHLSGCSRGGTCMEWESSSRHFSFSFGGEFSDTKIRNKWGENIWFKTFFFFYYWGIFEEDTDENIWNKE